MSEVVVFQMWGPFRESLVSNHKFYVEQSKLRLLSRFSDIEGEADRYAEKWLEDRGHLFDPDRHSPGEFEHQAYEEGIAHYGLLNEMRDTTRLSIIAAMFHEWDKQLRDWLARELLHVHTGAAATLAIWKANFSGIFDLLECLNWPVRSRNFFSSLDACRLIVNVYKHGLGSSFDDLKARHPQFLKIDTGTTAENAWAAEYADHTDLIVSDKNLDEFSTAIIEFWNDVPENTFASAIKSVPNWLEKALKKA